MQLNILLYVSKLPLVFKAIYCQDRSQEPDAEPGIFQSRSRLFRNSSSEPGNQDNVAERAAKSSRAKRVVNNRVNNTRRARLNRNLTKRCLSTIISKSGLLAISYRIMIKRSDGQQGEMTTLNTLSLWECVAHLTHTKGKHLGYNYLDKLSRDDETYARTLPKHKRHSIPND